MVSNQLSRARVLSRGVKTGAAMLFAGSAAGALATRAAADTIPDADLAYARLFVAVELLADDLYGRTIASKRFHGAELKYLLRARFNEQEHYRTVSQILSGAGQAPAVASDFDFSYPKGSFASRMSIGTLGVRLETLFLGVYLGAVGALQTNALEQPVARIAASEAQHLSIFTAFSGGNPVGVSFPNPLPIDEASGALDGFTS